MDKCAHANCDCAEASFEQEGERFCSATCADSKDAHDLADAMCGCAHEICVPAKS